MKNFSTKAIHGNRDCFLKQNGISSSLRFPIHDCAAFEFASSNDIENAFIGKVQNHSYSRSSNPTVSQLEMRLSFVNNAVATVVFSSGMAAVANLVFALCESGDNIVASNKLFGNTLSFFKDTLAKLAIEVKFVDFNKPNLIEEAINSNTQLIFYEHLTNPTIEVYDPAAIAKIGKEKNVLVAVDNTIATANLFTAHNRDIDIELYSLTKAISGGATVIGGAISFYDSNKLGLHKRFKKDFELYGPLTIATKLRKKITKEFGACLSAQSANYFLLGLETLDLRIERASQNALEIAKFLYGAKYVKKVHYPGLEDSPYHSIAAKIMNKNLFGSVLSFELESKKRCYEFMDKLKMVRRATNLCDNKTLIIHPASTIYAEMSANERQSCGAVEGLIRLSVGIEGVEDIKDEFQAVFEDIF